MVSTEDGALAEEKEAKMALRQLVEDAVKMAETKGLALRDFRGFALYDMRKDEKIQSLGSFEAAASMIVHLPRFVENFGADASQRITLQFVYQYFERDHTTSFCEEDFESLYDALIEELASPVWIFRGVANVKYFMSDIHHIDLNDGVTIQGRSPTDLASLGFGAAIWTCPVFVERFGIGSV